MADIAEVKQVNRQAMEQLIRRAEALAFDESPPPSTSGLSHTAAHGDIADGEFAQMAVEQAKQILKIDDVLHKSLEEFRRLLPKPGHAAQVQPLLLDLKSKTEMLRGHIVSIARIAPPSFLGLAPEMVESCQRIIDLADAIVAASIREIARDQAKRDAFRSARDAKALMPRLPLSDPPPKPKR